MTHERIRLAAALAGVLLAVLALGPDASRAARGAAAPAAALYAMANVGSGTGLVRLDAATGTTTVVATTAGTGVTYDLGALDPKRGRYYYGGTDAGGNLRLRTFDLAAGTVAEGPVLAPSSLNGLEVDPTDGRLYALAGGFGPLQRIDPVDGSVSTVAQVPSGYSIPLDVTAFDALRRRYLAIGYTGQSPNLTLRLLAVDVRTGLVALGPVLGQEVSGVEYDAVDDVLYGVQPTGPYGSGFRLLRFDAAGAWAIVGTAQGYSVPYAVTAYDTANHRYSAIGFTGLYPNVARRLFSIDVRDGNVTAGSVPDREPVNLKTDAPVPAGRVFLPFGAKASA